MLPSEENAKADVESGIYEAHYKIQYGDCVLDLGANVGYFTDLASEKVGPPGMVIAFEPHPENFALLLERVKSRPNVIPLNCGALHDYGQRAFYNHPLNCGGHSFFQSCDAHKFLKDCMTVDIGHWLLCWPFQPNFIKIDTEGSEEDIVLSLMNWGLLKTLPHIAVETHSTNAHKALASILSHTHNFTPTIETIGVCYADPK